MSCAGARRASPETRSWLQSFTAQKERSQPGWIGIPHSEAKVVEGLSVVFAADHALDPVVEVDFEPITSAVVSWLPTATSAGPNATSRIRTSRMTKTGRARIELAMM